MTPDPVDLWAFLPIGYAFTVLLETPVLLVGLSRPHPLERRLLAGMLLTACTYPMVVLILPLLITPTLGYDAYVGTAEVFAPTAECALFYFAFVRGRVELTNGQLARDMLAIVLANLNSWLLGGWLLARIVSWLGT